MIIKWYRPSPEGTMIWCHVFLMCVLLSFLFFTEQSTPELPTCKTETLTMQSAIRVDMGKDTVIDMNMSEFVQYVSDNAIADDWQRGLDDEGRTDD